MTAASGAQAVLHSVSFGGCYGALHLPSAGRARALAVLIVPPVGRDARCAYRPLWTLANQLAAGGVPVLRYDHLGTGDSAPFDGEADQWARWLDGVAEAADFLRRTTGIDAVVLAGLRLGATLAAVATERVRPEALMLLGPVQRGRQWLREQQFISDFVRLPTLPRPTDGSVEADGLRLTPASVASLRAVDLARLPPFQGPVFLAAQPAELRLAGALGPQVASTEFTGFEGLFKDAHSNEFPDETFGAAADWLGALAAARPMIATPAEPPAHRLAGADWEEQAVAFDGRRGVLTLPTHGRATRGLLIGNTGGDPRAGGGEFAVRAARRLAGQGVATLRFDFPGFGESDLAGPWRSHVYELDRTPDFRAAADVLARHADGPLVLGGVCAAAHHALKAAQQDRRFRNIAAINVSSYLWREGDVVQPDYAAQDANKRVNLRALMKAEAWRRLLRGEFDLVARFTGLARRIWRRWGWTPPGPDTRELRTSLAALSRDRARLLFLVGQEGGDLDELERHFGHKGRWLRRRLGVKVAVRAGLDHGLYFRDSRTLALDELCAFVLATPAGAPVPAVRAAPARDFVVAKRCNETLAKVF